MSPLASLAHQRGLVDQLAPGGVDQHGAGAQAVEKGGVDKAPGGVGEPLVEGHHPGGTQDLAHRRRAGAGGCQLGGVGRVLDASEDLAAEGDEQFGEAAGGVAPPDEADDQSPQVGTGPAGGDGRLRRPTGGRPRGSPHEAALEHPQPAAEAGGTGTRRSSRRGWSRCRTSASP